MELSTIVPHIEALIFASDKPLSAAEIIELTNNAFADEDKITPEQVADAISELSEKYHPASFPFEVRERGGGWQFLTKKGFHKTVVQLNGEKYLKRLSSASMETLAIVAYKQPVTKGEIESIRGVNSDYSIQKLLEKELIVITGRNEELPGKPLTYATSKNFMDYFGINSAGELPRIREVLAEQTVAPTVVNVRMDAEKGENGEVDEPEADDPGGEEQASLVVRGNGELIEEPEVVVNEGTDAIDPATLNDPAENGRQDSAVAMGNEESRHTTKTNTPPQETTGEENDDEA